jgi:hypothetical protein
MEVARNAFGPGDTKVARDTVVGYIKDCEQPVVVRGLFRARKECGAFFREDGSLKRRIIEVRNRQE